MGHACLFQGVSRKITLDTMALFFHRLKHNKGTEFPRNYVFLDTETTEEKTGPATRLQRLRLGCAKYVRLDREDRPGKEAWLDFTTARQFWTWAVATSEPDRRLVILAFNAGFDMRISDGFNQLRKLGYEQHKIYIGQTVLILMFRRGKHSILILDACNYFDGTLEAWGDMLSLPKVRVDFKRVSTKRLALHCRRDVEILEALWFKWKDFVCVNDLGHFTPTRSAQALSAFTHRFMTQPLFLHADFGATKLERASYYGGRVECFRVGRIPGGPFWKLDVNSMYPAVMEKGRFPRKLLGVYSGFPLSEVRACAARHCVIADCIVKTDIPAYPMRLHGGVVFPVGTFTTALASPELCYALDNGHIDHIARFAVYRQAVMFKSFVQAMFRLRHKYRQEGNTVFEQMVKKIMNSLYGKFGQHSEVWEKGDNSGNQADGFYKVMNDDTGQPEPLRVIAGQAWLLKGRRESYHSFPGISACITSAARLRLWQLIIKAGRENVFYCDTDSLIVNRVGRARLASDVDSGKLGFLKEEYKTDKLTLRAPKDYMTDTEDKTKGIPKTATALGGNKFRYWSWQGLTGAIHGGMTEGVAMTKTVKVLSRQYDKGRVLPGGVVLPLLFSGNLAQTR